MKENKKLYVIKKYVMARSAAHAIKLDKSTPVDSIWIDNDWTKGEKEKLAAALGYAP